MSPGIEESIDLGELEGSQYLEHIQRIRDGVDTSSVDETRDMLSAMKDAREEQPLRVSRLDISRTQAEVSGWNQTIAATAVDSIPGTLPAPHRRRRA